VRLFCSAMIMFFLAWPALAQTVVGRAVVDGRTVTLFDNQSWQFETADEAGCKLLSAKLSFCGDPIKWHNTRVPAPDVIAAYRYNDQQYGQFIVENLGTAQGLTSESVRKIILDIARQASGQDPVVISITPASLGELSGETVVYTFNISGLETVYANSLFLTENTLLQAMTYAVGTSTYSPTHETIHAELLAVTQLKVE
jgi:hypothetical protein